jgi:ATP-dependent protease ClpP protease subunit
MIYCINETSAEPIMLINTHIGSDDTDGQGIDGALFQKELLYLDSLGKERIQIWINSVGGNVMDGYNIGSAILKTATPVDTYNVGISASIAGVIWMCGRNRYMMDYALLMMHQPNGGSNQKMLNTMQESLSIMLGAKSNLDPAVISDLMNQTTWMTAQESMDKGFCTEIESTKESNDLKMISSDDYADIFMMANKVTNRILNNVNNEKSMLKVTNKLGLQDDANEESILGAIASMQNQFDSEKEVLATEIENAETALSDLKLKYEALEADVLVNKEAVQLESATNMIKGFAEAGKIKNEEGSISKWVNLAKADFEGTKAMIEDLPLNVVSNKIIVDETAKARTPDDFMHDALKAIKNKNK